MASSRPRRPGIARWQKATAVVPLALLAGAWTASLGTPTTATADSAVHDPGVPAVPTTSLDGPASYTVPRGIAPSTTTTRQNQPGIDPSSISVNGIPTAAMTAYQRAAAVLAEADPGCHLSWALVAAIGRVESDHGRFGGNVLGTDGRAKPGIYGLPLDGTGATALIRDTDSGGYDKDAVYDRAVGPMQFIPSTWAVVGVDGDADGTRDPQDIDDAALATAVYLCAGDQDLSTTPGQRAAVFSYNHSDRYVALVLAIMNAYLDGDYTTVADGLPTSTFLAARPAPQPRAQSPKHSRHDTARRHQPRAQRPTAPSTRTSTRTSTSASPRSGTSRRGDSPTASSSPTQTQTPRKPRSSNPGGTPTAPPTAGPAPTAPVPPVTSAPTADPTQTVKDTAEPVVAKLETVSEATLYCADHLPGDPSPEMVSACGQKLVGKTNEEAAQLLSGSLLEVLARLGLSSLAPAPALPTSGLPTGN